MEESKNLKVYWKPEAKNSVWKVCSKDKIPKNAMFVTCMAFLEEPKGSEEKRDPKLAVRRFGDYVLDIDSKDLGEAQKTTVHILDTLMSKGVNVKQLRLYFSGSKGFHVIVPAELLGAEGGHPFLPKIYGALDHKLFPKSEFKDLDGSMRAMGRGKMFRLPNVKRENARHKIRITHDELLNKGHEWFVAMSANPREEWAPKSPSLVEALANEFKELTTYVEEAMEAATQRPSGDSVPFNKHEIPPCLIKVLSLEEKLEENISFNELCFGCVVPALRKAGFDVSEAVRVAEVEVFLDNFADSTAYTTPQARMDHFLQVWATDEGTQKEFSCAQMWRACGGDWGMCHECRIYAEAMFSDFDLDDIPEEVYDGGVDAPAVQEQVLAPTAPAATVEKKKSTSPIIEKLNKRFALTTIGGKEAIIWKKKDGVQLLSKRAFDAVLDNKRVASLTPAGKPTEISQAAFWMRHPDREFVHNIVFKPGGKEKRGEYNMWRGFAIEEEISLAQAVNLCKVYLKHVKEVVCNGDEELYTYVMCWMAHLVQKPEEKPGVALVMRGREGTGKGSFVRPLSEIVGDTHATIISHRAHFFSQFNASLENKVLIYLDEAVWAGNKAEAGVLKSFVTEPTVTVERKGYERYSVDSFCRVIMSSNEDWVVPAGKDARRFLVLDVSDEHMQNCKGHFKKLYEEFDNGCAKGLYMVLKKWPISVNVRKAPHTKALADQIRLSLDSVDTFWSEILEEGKMPCLDSHSVKNEDGSWEVMEFDSEDWPGAVNMSTLHSAYLNWCSSLKIPSYDIKPRKSFSARINRYICPEGVGHNENRFKANTVYKFGCASLEECVERFGRETKTTSDR